jgi:hypothetical protein
MKLNFLITLAVIGTGLTSAYSQSTGITRVEFNSGTRTYREQVIITKDSVIAIEEDFRKDKTPKIKRRVTKSQEWNNVVDAAKGINISGIENLKSPTNKRDYDGASQGSLIITTSDNKSFNHAFDDEEPHESLQPLMKSIRKVTGIKKPKGQKEKK